MAVVCAAGKFHINRHYDEGECGVGYYVEQEVQRGHLPYAASLGLPVISCFVEIRDEKVFFGIWNTRYIVHILPAIYPDSSLGIKKAAIKMMETDYLQKKTAYEAAYGKPLDYVFEGMDIAGRQKENTLKIYGDGK